MRRLLDLYCGGGGAAMGYHEAGFDEIVGVDIVSQPRYPFTFIRGDALEYVRQYGHEFDAIHASPPCQAYNSLHKVNGRLHGKRYPNLIAATRKALQATGKPYVIENVLDAKKHLIDPVMLCGTFFGLKVYRHRLFECNPSLSHLQPRHVPHDDRSPGCNGNRTSPKGYITVCGGKGGGFRIEPASKAMGIDWMIRRELAQAIPPAYTRWIGQKLLEVIAEMGLTRHIHELDEIAEMVQQIEPGCENAMPTLEYEFGQTPEEKATATTAAKQTKSTGDYTMSVTTPQSVLGELINLHKSEVEVVATSDLDELKKLESEIKSIQESAWVEVGRRLTRIKFGKTVDGEEGLWKAGGYTSWDTYCRDRWKLAKSTANEMIAGVKVLEEVDVTASSLPLSKNATKPLAKMLNAGKKPEEVQEFIQELAESKPGQELSKEVIEDAAIERGLLPKKSVKPIVAQAQSVGLSGKESQQLPDSEINADIPPERIRASLADCFSILDVTDFIKARLTDAVTEFAEMTWQERNNLRRLTQGTIDNQLMANATEHQRMQVMGLLSTDKDARIEYLEGVVIKHEKNAEERWEQFVVVRDERDRLAARVAELEAELGQVRRVA